MIHTCLVLLLTLFVTGCSMITPEDIAGEPIIQGKVRFILSFDDGPSVSTDIYGRNPTEYILQQLANNPVEPDIKSIFFVQTRNNNGGGTLRGKALLAQIDQAGHLVGLHSASPQGHVAHTSMTINELDKSLKYGVQDIRDITGYRTPFVRPPSWHFNQKTVQVYQQNHLHMMLTDINARDGVIHIFKFSFRRRSHFNASLYKIRQKILRNELARVDGVIPVIITFHDPNTFTANHMIEYLQIILQESSSVSLPVDTIPFYNDTLALKNALFAKAYTESGINE